MTHRNMVQRLRDAKPPRLRNCRRRATGLARIYDCYYSLQFSTSTGTNRTDQRRRSVSKSALSESANDLQTRLWKSVSKNETTTMHVCACDYCKACELIIFIHQKHNIRQHRERNLTNLTREYTVWVKKSSPPITFCDIFTCGKPVYLKIITAIAQTYSYVYTNFGPFIWIFVWIVSFLLVRPLKF